MPTLIDIGETAMKIQDALFELQGELTPEMEQALDNLLADGSEALDSAAWVVRKLTNDADACRAEAKRLLERSASFDRQSDALKGRMLFAVDAAFGGKLKTPLNTIWAQQSGKVTSIEVAPDADLERMWNTNSALMRRTLALDKVEIKHRFEAGEPLPPEISVTELPGTRYLRIK